MITTAEQYRALVARLEAINPSEPVLEADDDFVSTQADGPTGVTTQGPDTSPAGVETPPAAASPDILKQIEHAPTFKEAYAMAVKAGLKRFKWCQCKEYQVKAAPKPAYRPQGPGQAAQPKPRPYASSGGTSAKDDPEANMVPGTYYPDPNSGGFNATYNSPRKSDPEWDEKVRQDRLKYRGPISPTPRR